MISARGRVLCTWRAESANKDTHKWRKALLFNLIIQTEAINNIAWVVCIICGSWFYLNVSVPLVWCNLFFYLYNSIPCHARSLLYVLDKGCRRQPRLRGYP